MNKGIYYSGYRKEMLQFIPEGCKTILEVGCGEGNFLMQLKNDVVELWGIEPDLSAAGAAASKLHKVINNTLEDALATLPDNYFDLIIFNDVLEHMHHPVDNIFQIKSKLSNTGNIVASIPNFRYVKSLYQIVVNRNWTYADHGILDYTHFRFFTRKSIISMFSDSGYEIKKIKGINPTKSVKFHILTAIFSLFTFTNQFDMLFMQFAVVAKKRNQIEKPQT